ncbi:coiled-coil domain-containing protein 3a isoform X2 [Pangasianodon hypophthalmus]|uniref:coiled-coil domain-containing protein 3a isoform X2 n=1 Tax=Pangasianodon hypophthalmus TaxID=310915 RepID=UPI00147EA46A|nr:coiled-coil domain-containing protein 3a isoform X2 [Pangasianodon hypophthalmus]
MLLPALLSVWTLLRLGLGCQLPTEWRPLSEGCRAELAEIIVYAKVLALYREPYYPLSARYTAGHPYEYERAGAESAEALLYTAEVEMLCDQAWGSMLEVPAGSRLNVTGLGYLSCQSHTVMENYSYIFFLSVNYQEAIFPDTQENRRMFSSLFQFSNCSSEHTLHSFSPDWEHQEDHRLLCSSVQQVLFEEEERAGRLQEHITELEKKNQKLKDRVGKLKRSLRKVRKTSRRYARELQELQQRMSTNKKNSEHHLNSITPPHRLSRHRYTHTL